MVKQKKTIWKEHLKYTSVQNRETGRKFYA